MKKIVLFAFLSILIATACNKDELVRDDLNLDNRTQNQVDICHNGNIISVNINAIPAHQAHGDAVDMDDDGYFDVDNVCGPTDCDDNDPDSNETCGLDCGTENWFFCSFVDLFDFDEPCPENYGQGDHICDRDVNTYYPEISRHIMTLVDKDDSSSCGPGDDDNDYGYISVIYGMHANRGPFGYFEISYNNHIDPPVYDRYEGYGQANYNKAVAAAAFLYEAGIQMGLNDVCPN